MKVLQVHNHYDSSQPSGENRVVLEERDLLEAAGVEVATLYTHSDEIHSLRQKVAATGLQLGMGGADVVERLLQDFKPDVVHVHNLQPLITPRLLDLCAGRGIAAVRTVHNYRAGCVAGTHFRDGHACFDCIERNSSFPGVVHRCYRGSATQSALVTLSRRLHGSAYSAATLLVALTEYMRDYLIRLGCSQEQVVVRPNPIAHAGLSDPLAFSNRDDVLFVGRLDKAKGIDLLLESWPTGPRDQPVLRIVGSGPLEPLVQRHARERSNVTFAGTMTQDAVLLEMSRALAVILPSRWAEGFPRVIAEAWAVGTPVICNAESAAGALVSEQRGWVTDMQALPGMLPDLINRPSWMLRSQSAVEYAERHLTQRAGLASLLEIYERAVRLAATA